MFLCPGLTVTQNDLLDWNGDHPHTNYRTLFTRLTGAGYYVELNMKPLSCVDLPAYGAVVLIDTESNFYDDELLAVARVRSLGLHLSFLFVTGRCASCCLLLHPLFTFMLRLTGIQAVEGGLGLVVLGEWYDPNVASRIGFFDENTRSHWAALTGCVRFRCPSRRLLILLFRGANVPALNALLSPFGISFSSHVYSGNVRLGGKSQQVRFVQVMAWFDVLHCSVCLWCIDCAVSSGRVSLPSNSIGPVCNLHAGQGTNGPRGAAWSC